MADDHKGPHHIHPRPYADGYPVLQGTQGDASVPTLIRTAPAPTQVDGWGFGCQCSLEPFELMFRFPGSFASQPQTRHRSGHLTHVTVRAASTAQYLHQLSRQMVLVQLLVEGEQAVDTLVEEAIAVAPLVDPVHQQSVRPAGHPFVAALRILWHYHDQPHRLPHLPRRSLQWLFFSFFFASLLVFSFHLLCSPAWQVHVPFSIESNRSVQGTAVPSLYYYFKYTTRKVKVACIKRTI